MLASVVVGAVKHVQIGMLLQRPHDSIMANFIDVEGRKGAKRGGTREHTARKTREVLRENDYAEDSSWQRREEAECRRQGVREDKIAGER